MKWHLAKANINLGFNLYIQWGYVSGALWKFYFTITWGDLLRQEKEAGNLR